MFWNCISNSEHRKFYHGESIRYQRNSSTVGLRGCVLHTRIVYYTSVDRDAVIYFDLLWSYGFVVQLYSNWRDFNWHSASRGPSAVAELLVVAPSQTELKLRVLMHCMVAFAAIQSARYDGMAKLSWPEWLVTYWDGLPARRRRPSIY